MLICLRVLCSLYIGGVDVFELKISVGSQDIYVRNSDKSLLAGATDMPALGAAWYDHDGGLYGATFATDDLSLPSESRESCQCHWVNEQAFMHALRSLTHLDIPVVGLQCEHVSASMHKLIGMLMLYQACGTADICYGKQGGHKRLLHCSLCEAASHNQQGFAGDSEWRALAATALGALSHPLQLC